MRTITLEELLEAGCHFGHQVTRQNPKSRDYIFEARDNIHIIDLEKTKEGLEKAGSFVYQLAKNKGIMIILGTKRQAEGVVKEAVSRAQKEGVYGLYYITNRWIGGLLTNFGEVSKNFKRMEELKKKLSDSSERAKYTKKEISLLERELQKLESFYSGIAGLNRIPDALYIIDTHLEDLAVREALAMDVTTVGITDTNADPTKIDYPIPANDDAVGSIKLITDYLVDCWIEGRKHISNSNKENAKVKNEAENTAKQSNDKKGEIARKKENQRTSQKAKAKSASENEKKLMKRK